MKKILVLGDIHANYPALKTIHSYIDGDRFDAIINTGDFTVYSTFPNETIQWFRKRKKSICIMGNTDIRVLKILKGKKLKRPRKDKKRVMYYWTAENLLPENINYLKALTRHRNIKIENQRIGVFHGSPDDFNETLFPDTFESRFRELTMRSPYHINIMGHSHMPYYKNVDGIHFINPGSVGRMFDGDPRTSFAILYVSPGSVSVEHFRIPYPVEDVVNGLEKHHLPAIYATMYRKGKKLN